jgi:hypothetical protein
VKKIVLVIFLLACMFAGGALATGWHNVTKSHDAFISTSSQDRFVMWCDAFAGNGLFWAKVTSDTETLGYLAAVTGEWSQRLDLTKWNTFIKQGSGVAKGDGGFNCEDEACYVDVVTKSTNAFWQCTYVDPN